MGKPAGLSEVVMSCASYSIAHVSSVHTVTMHSDIQVAPQPPSLCVANSLRA